MTSQLRIQKKGVQEYSGEGGYYSLMLVTNLRNHNVTQKQHRKTETESHIVCELVEREYEAVQSRICGKKAEDVVRVKLCNTIGIFSCYKRIKLTRTCSLWLHETGRPKQQTG